jgi:toxin ParE1/3/4
MTAAAISPRANRELLAAARWIERDNPAAAENLIDAVERAGLLIGDNRYIGRVRHELAPDPYRFLTLSGFPYILVYDADRTPPLIVRIVHGARDLPEVLRDL